MKKNKLTISTNETLFTYNLMKGGIFSQAVFAVLLCLFSASFISCASTPSGSGRGALVQAEIDKDEGTDSEGNNISGAAGGADGVSADKNAGQSSEEKKEPFKLSEYHYSLLNISPEEYDKRTEGMSDEQKKFYAIKRTRYYDVIGVDLDYKVVVNDKEKEIIIQYEESDSDEDWHNNYLFWPWPLKLDKKVVWTSYGYAKIYKSAKNQPMDEFYSAVQAHPDYKVRIWGWSLGSAMAKITARHFIIRTKGKQDIDELTTFGDVKCWYNPFYSSKKHCVVIHEYVTPNDLISWCIPICRRDVKCKVGEKFSFKKSKYSEDYHTSYEKYDYSKWE